MRRLIAVAFALVCVVATTVSGQAVGRIEGTVTDTAITFGDIAGSSARPITAANARIENATAVRCQHAVPATVRAAAKPSPPSIAKVESAWLLLQSIRLPSNTAA